MRPSKFHYTIYRDNSPDAFVNFCIKFEKEYPNAIKEKYLVDVDGSTIQLFTVNGQRANIYDDYDVGAVYALSDWDISFLDHFEIGQLVKILKCGIYGRVVEIREFDRSCTIERDTKNKEGIYERIECNLYNIEPVEDKSVIWKLFPARDFMIEDMYKLAENVESEQKLAGAYAIISNTYRRIRNYLYDDEEKYDEKSFDFREARAALRDWEHMENKLRQRIYDVLKREGVDIPKKGFHWVLVPFMERNGFRDDNGWWINKSDDFR